MPEAPLTAAQLTTFVQGTLIGAAELSITGAGSLTEATTGQLSFLAGDAAIKDARHTQASLLLVHRPIDGLPCAQIVVPNPALAMARVVQEFFVRRRQPTGVSGLAFCGKDVTLGAGVSIGPFVILEDRVAIGRGTTLYPGVFVGEGTRIGDDCLIYPHVTIREEVTIGNRVILHPGVVIGSDGFGFLQDGGRHHKIPQIGTVVIEDDVELGANVTVDRATYGRTIIGRGTKVDNLVQIAHNVEVGEHNVLVSQVGIAGSSKTGHHVIVGGQAGIADHVTVGDQAMIAARAGLNRDVPAKEVIAGFPALPRVQWLKAMAIVAKLPELRQQLRDMEERLKVLEGKVAASPAATPTVKSKRKR